MDIFRKDKRRVFFIRKVHKDHTKSVCAKRRKVQQRVFRIEKTGKKTSDDSNVGKEEFDTTDGNVVSSKTQKCEETYEFVPTSNFTNTTNDIRNLIVSNQRIINSYWNFEPNCEANVYSNLLKYLNENQNSNMHFMEEPFQANSFILFLQDIYRLSSYVENIDCLKENDIRSVFKNFS